MESTVGDLVAGGSEFEFGLRSGDVVLSAVSGDVAGLRARADALGARIIVVDLAMVGLPALVERANEAAATVVVLPALVGRWLADRPVVASSVRRVVVLGDEVDEGARAGIERAFGAQVAVEARSTASAPTPWVARVRLASLPGVAAAVVAGSGGASIDDRAWVLVIDADVFDEASAVALAHEVGLELAVEHSEARWQQRLAARAEPSDELERSLANLVASVTSWGVLGVGVDLVERGVTRSADALVSEIDRVHGVRLRAGELLEHRTVAALAEVVRRDRGRRVRRPVTTTLAPGDGGAPPLFLLHEIDGSPFPQLALAAGLGGRVVGFDAPGLQGATGPFRDLELMAMRYLVDVRRIQPDGPHRLAGRGFGGALAYEMARQLVDEGGEVERLVIADTGPSAVVPVRAQTALEREHLRLWQGYGWPSSSSLDVVVGWSLDVGSRDSSLGWADVVGFDHLEIRRIAVVHDGDRSAVDEAWSAVLRSVDR